MSKFRDVKKIACDAWHKCSDLCVIIVGKWKLLKMTEKVPSHIGFNSWTHYMTDGSHIIVCGSIYYPEDKIKQRTPYNEFSCQFNSFRSSCRSYFSYNHREHKLTNCCKRGTEQVCEHYETVFFVIRQKSFQYADLTFVFFHVKKPLRNMILTPTSLP